MNIEEQRIEAAQSLDKYESQRNWYSKRASEFKHRSQWVSLIILICGGLITFIPIFKPVPPTHWSEYLVSVLGLVIVIAQGILRIWGWDQIWPEYRKASERMKREQRLYIYNATPYAEIDDETLAKRRYTEALEQIIAEEQKIYWQDLIKDNQS